MEELVAVPKKLLAEILETAENDNQVAEDMAALSNALTRESHETYRAKLRELRKWMEGDF